jgi:hypothetical protein
MANTTQTGSKMGQMGPETAKPMDKAKEAAAGVMDKAKEAASHVADKARDVASAAGDRAENLTHRVGSGMESLGEQLRERAPQGGTMGAVAGRVAENLQSGGRYLQEEGLSGMADDLGDLMRRNPVPTLLIGIGIGFLIARAVRS